MSYDDEGALAITLLPSAGVGAPPSIPFSEVALEDETLTCVDEDGVPGYLAMVPAPDGGN